MQQSKQTRQLIIVGILSGISVILMFIKFPLPFLPPYLTLDFSDVPALLATFTLGPIAGILVEFIKNLLNFFFYLADPVGPVANFIAGSSLLLTAYGIYRYKPSTRGMLIGLAAGTLIMTIVLSIMNYFVLLPLYGMIMNLADIATNLKIIITAGIIPFNIIKGFVVSLLFILLYKRLKHVLKI
ncbi:MULTISPECIES: ECF transporter S component [unclassified Staphylococcus]|uniref:ECF transporter S component n=1 Tax=unclassified Staphylococcus TaxID=91994 RepID=UPI0021D033BA|nr:MULTISPECIES: ECF transporter S component [unclassified Staphylococcus]UXR79268.1 ECF transporter S component [Staphylococcus sp. IVB6227]UXR81519.1 ECF transporter S component [Staphylococcus sp. IVB6214]